MISRRRLAILLPLLLLPVAVHAQDAPFVRDVFNRINAQRKQHGLETLAYNTTLEKAAQAHAEWMARSRKMEHLQAPPGSFEQHATCNHHPINRAIHAGSIG
jgi:uncharacterized protein YkwD